MVTLNIIEINGLKQYQIMLGTSIITTYDTESEAVNHLELINAKLGNNSII
jgi:hypothetical protein